MTRPPYGDTEGLFELEGARAMLANVEHEPHDQMISDSLWVELRLACDEVERLQFKTADLEIRLEDAEYEARVASCGE